ncbi:venom acid phosphatase Acph-1-like [Onthophagus taurus]|uniref:venom acid phosphatase Acph-1-like n=1 Tax=Onthophagus taurus TaxID=166361 RepID=UPI000C203740|nr:venom acid phosphatase Acph-1-like [Onthophagus taurus]
MLTLFLIISVFSSIFAATEENLLLVHVFFRHGSRTPEEKDIYPNDPYTIQDFEPMGWGQLTNVGKQRAYKLGKLLRKRYNHFLGEIYTPDIVEMTSTDYDRTKMSALLVLAGLFPPTSSQKWDDHLSWMPIPYHFDKNDYDYFIRRPTGYCPNYVKELNKIYESEDYKNLLSDHKETFEYIEENSGKPIKTLYDVFSIYQTLHAEETMNFTLPEWTKPIYPGLIDQLAGKQCEFENYNPILKRLNGGRMLKIVLNQMLSKIKDELPKERKIYLYSGHENNVINILAALNVFKAHVPKYSAAAIIELYYVPLSNEYRVKVFYEYDVNEEFRIEIISGCEESCEIGKFMNLVDDYVPKNYTAECGSDAFLN